jgi:hypothetical protein
MNLFPKSLNVVRKTDLFKVVNCYRLCQLKTGRVCYHLVVKYARLGIEACLLNRNSTGVRSTAVRQNPYLLGRGGFTILNQKSSGLFASLVVWLLIVCV